MVMDNLVLITLAFAPLFILGYYLGRESPNLLLLGGVGWVLALALRIIPLNLFQLFVRDLMAVIIYSSVLAGSFEEGMRFWLVRRTKFSDLKAGLTFGLGWGIAEALVMFFPSLLLSPSSLTVSLVDLLPGVLERYMAVLVHIALTIIIVRSISYREYLLVAVAAHTVLDFIAGITYYVMRFPVWHVEALLTAYTISLAVYALLLFRKVH